MLGPELAKWRRCMALRRGVQCRACRVNLASRSGVTGSDVGLHGGSLSAVGRDMLAGRQQPTPPVDTPAASQLRVPSECTFASGVLLHIVTPGKRRRVTPRPYYGARGRRARPRALVAPGFSAGGTSGRQPCARRSVTGSSHGCVPRNVSTRCRVVACDCRASSSHEDVAASHNQCQTQNNDLRGGSALLRVTKSGPSACSRHMGAEYRDSCASWMCTCGGNGPGRRCNVAPTTVSK